MKSKIGVSKTGEVQALEFESYLDGGAYGSYGVASTFYTGALQTVTYRMKNYHFRGARFFTNKAPCGPKRGHGTPQPRCALEVQLDRVATDLGLDPAEVRLKNLAPKDSLTANFLRIGSMGTTTRITPKTSRMPSKTIMERAPTAMIAPVLLRRKSCDYARPSARTTIRARASAIRPS